MSTLQERHTFFDQLPDRLEVDKADLLALFTAAIDCYDIIRRQANPVRTKAGTVWVSTAEADACRQFLDEFDRRLFGSSFLVTPAEDCVNAQPTKMKRRPKPPPPPPSPDKTPLGTPIKDLIR